MAPAGKLAVVPFGVDLQQFRVRDRIDDGVFRVLLRRRAEEFSWDRYGSRLLRAVRLPDDETPAAMCLRSRPYRPGERSAGKATLLPMIGASRGTGSASRSKPAST